MKITVEKDNGDIVEFEFEHGVGNKTPMLNKALRDIQRHGEIKEGRHLKNVKHIKKDKKDK